jgi:hypothetical protein
MRAPEPRPTRGARFVLARLALLTAVLISVGELAGPRLASVAAPAVASLTCALTPDLRLLAIDIVARDAAPGFRLRANLARPVYVDGYLLLPFGPPPSRPGFLELWTSMYALFEVPLVALALGLAWPSGSRREVLWRAALLLPAALAGGLLMPALRLRAQFDFGLQSMVDDGDVAQVLPGLSEMLANGGASVIGVGIAALAISLAAAPLASATRRAASPAPSAGATVATGPRMAGLLALLLPLAGLVLSPHAGAQVRAAAGSDTPLEVALRAGGSIDPAIAARARRLDTALLVLAEEVRRFDAANAPRARFRSSLPHLRVRDQGVTIDAVAEDGDAASLQASLEAIGLTQASTFGRVVSGRLPLRRIDDLGMLHGLRLARVAALRTRAGLVTSQGDVAMRADAARAARTVDGSGVTVGVLSDSYDCLGGAATDVASGDLPGSVAVLVDATTLGCGSSTDEGRAMLQLVHDLAPGAALAFHTAVGGTAGFANGILALRRTAGARVIVDDLLYYAEPMFQDGPIAQAVDTAVAEGAAYFSSAGNIAAQSYDSAFRQVQGSRHDFDPGTGVTTRLPVTIPANASVVLVLQWDDPFASVSGPPGADSDLDLRLYTASGTLVAAAATVNVGGDPVEVLGITNGATVTDYRLAIDRRAGPVPGRLKLVWFGSFTAQQFVTGGSTVYGHANAAGARAVGAAYYQRTPAFGVSPPLLETFSSRGGTPILFDSAGVQIAELTRAKPELVAADGGDTTFFGFDTDGNGRPNFLGTSAAAPHAAAVAALALDLAPGATPARLYGALQDSAIDMEVAGFDVASGLGLVDAAGALQLLLPPGGDVGIGFGSAADGSVLSGSVPLGAYAALGLTLGTSSASGGSAALASVAVPSFGFNGAALRTSSAVPGAASATLDFAQPIAELRLSFATDSGTGTAELYDSVGTRIATVALAGTASIAFSDGARLGGEATLGAAAIARVVLRGAATDNELRLDGLQWRVADADSGPEVPLPWPVLLTLALGLPALAARHGAARRRL